MHGQSHRSHARWKKAIVHFACRCQLVTLSNFIYAIWARAIQMTARRLQYISAHNQLKWSWMYFVKKIFVAAHCWHLVFSNQSIARSSINSLQLMHCAVWHVCRPSLIWLKRYQLYVCALCIPEHGHWQTKWIDWNHSASCQKTVIIRMLGAQNLLIKSKEKP